MTEEITIENKIETMLEMLNILDEKITKINNRFSHLARELGYRA